MSIVNILLLILGYFLLLLSTRMIDAGGISMMRRKATSDAQERIFSWFAGSIVPFLGIGVVGGIYGLGNMVFAAALAAGVLQVLLVYGMLGMAGSFRLAGNALRDLVILLVCVVILVLFTNYTWSKGHPDSTIGRGAAVVLLILAVLFALWTMPYYMGKSRTLQRPPAYDFIPSLVFTVVGIAFAGLGSVLLLDNTAKLTYDLKVGQGILGFAIIGTGLILPEYIRTGRRYWMNTKKPVAIRGTLATGNLGLLLMIGMAAVISPFKIMFGEAVLLLACVGAIAVFGAAFYLNRGVGRVKAAIFLAVYAAIFLLYMNFSLR